MKTWRALPPLPMPNSVWFDRSGQPTPEAYRYLAALDRMLREVRGLSLNDLADLDLSTPPTDGQQLTYVEADEAWKPGTA